MDLWVAGSGSGGRAGWAFRVVRDRELLAEGAGVLEGTSSRAELVAIREGALAVPADVVGLRVLTPNANHGAAIGPRLAGRSARPARNEEVLDEAVAALSGRDVRFAVPSTAHVEHKAVRKAALEASGQAALRPDGRATTPADIAAPSLGSATLVAYTDGGCRGNPGPGGWGFVLIHAASGVTLEGRGGEDPTTNNRMEMLAAIRALEALTRPGQDVEIRTDSSYLRDLASKWMRGWKRRGWKRPSPRGASIGRPGGEPIANLDLVQRLDELCALHRVTWTKVPGHAGEPGNERADRLTNEAMDDLRAGRDPTAQVRYEGGMTRLRGLLGR